KRRCHGPVREHKEIMMSILGIDEITYGVEDRDKCRQFFLDWGLELVAEEPQRLVFESLNGCRVIIADHDNPDLPPAFEAGSTLREVVWGVDSDAELQRLKPLLAKTDGFIETDNRVGCMDPNELAIRFQVTRKRDIDVEGCPTNTWGQHERVDQPAAI